MDKGKKLSVVNREATLPVMDDLYRNSIELIQYARHIATRQVNLVQLLTFYSLGRWIVEEQQ